MKICALIRGWRQDPDGGLHPEMLGHHERFVLQAARGLVDDQPNGEVWALGAGDRGIDEVLGAARALGAHRLYRLWDPLLADVDPLGLARALSYAIREVGADLVLAGFRSRDQALGYQGPAVAEFLDLPHLTAVTSLRWLDPGASVEAGRFSAGQLYRHELRLPCVLSLQSAAPLDPPAPESNRDPEIKVLSFTDLGVEAALIQPRIRLKTEITADPPPAIEISWVEDAALLSQHLRDLELVP